MHLKSIIAVSTILIVSFAHGLTFTYQTSLHPYSSTFNPSTRSNRKNYHNDDKQIHHTTYLHASPSREEEIAAMEEKLKALKEEAEAEALSEINSDDVPKEPYYEMLSEQWKESEISEDGNSSEGVIVKAVGFVAFLVALLLFAQVPVGQEGLDQYSTLKPNTSIDLGSWSKTPEE